ncbi:1-phosphofructokinase family hexose kinase [Trichococcus sp.]|jgi:tagatose 6-phosphate kinase|uniref:1-phosphofructokinase family hexose kinase n=1 Tax=Trichococcus sp. TaxID=1985464 RepID=UPI003C7B6201
MIITVTMNPSLDHAYFIDHFSLGRVNRFLTPKKSIGGKGINAGRTASLSGSKVILSGFLGGDLGDLVGRDLKAENLFELMMLSVPEETRRAITVMHDGNVHTELIESGPKVSDELAFNLMNEIKDKLEKENASVITINGSVNSSNKHLYKDLLKYIRSEINPTIPVLMDISGEQLLSLLESHDFKPTFIKPNIHELGELLGKSISSKEVAIKELSNELFDGIEYIMISCGSEGALFKAGDKYYDVTIPKIKIINPTGSGDATVGGFAYALEQKYSIVDTLKYSMACGMSNAQHAEVGVINKKDVEIFMTQIEVKQL